MDRRVELPSFREVAGALPSPSFSPTAATASAASAAPRPIPFGRTTTRSSNSFPQHYGHGAFSGPHHSHQQTSGGSSDSHPSTGSRYSIHNDNHIGNANSISHTGIDNSGIYRQQQHYQQQNWQFVAHPSSYPRQPAMHAAIPSSSPLLPPPPIKGHYEQQQQQRQRASSYTMYKDGGGVISPYEAAHQSQSHINNVHAVAQMTTDPIMMQHRKSSSLLSHSQQQQSSFMHSPPLSSSRFAPYHMPSAAHSLPQASAALVRTSPSPKPRHKGIGGNNGDLSVSRAVAAISSVALSSPISPTLPAPPATASQHKQNAAFPAKMAPSPLHSHSPRFAVASNASAASPTLPINIPPPLAITHSPPSPPTMSSMSMPHQRMENSMPEPIEEDDAEEVLDCYDEGQQQGADGTIMSNAKIRTIHKLAERRRRREMKNLFDTLRKCLPVDKTVRLSKWEVLKKAIEVINSQDAEIQMLRHCIDSSKSNAYKQAVN
ncbi:hypothetical protein BX070DRAFT_120208 [Coemansia spiralis]|nr:hypothetical protein BX070DRAFT_120208 [Coemansia spiralis]